MRYAGPYPADDTWRAQWGSGRGAYADSGTYVKVAEGRFELKPAEKKKPQPKVVVLKTRDQAPPLSCSVSQQMFAGVFVSD
jgi:hypothetical protein